MLPAQYKAEPGCYNHAKAIEARNIQYNCTFVAVNYSMAVIGCDKILQKVLWESTDV